MQANSGPLRVNILGELTASETWGLRTCIESHSQVITHQETFQTVVQVGQLAEDC